MPLPDHIGYADLYEVAPTSAIDRSGVRPLNEWMEIINGFASATGESAGDEQYLFNATNGQVFDLRLGTAAVPDTELHPGIKVTRTMEITAATGGASDRAEQFASILGIAVGTDDMVGQPVGVAGIAETSHLNAGGEPRTSDACGVYGIGKTTGNAIGMGAFFAGRGEASNSKMLGVEILCWNFAATGVYSTTTMSNSMGLWVSPLGDYDSAVGIAISANLGGTGQRFKVGLGFPAVDQGGGIFGGVSDSSIRDDGRATTSIDIRGTHTTGMALSGTFAAYGIDFNSGTFAGQIRFKNNSPVYAQNAANSAPLQILNVNASDVLLVGLGTTGIYLGQTVSIADGKNISIDVTTGTKIGISTSAKIGFYNATPVIRQTVGAALSTGGAETNTNLATRINDIRTALINLGLVA